MILLEPEKQRMGGGLVLILWITSLEYLEKLKKLNEELNSKFQNEKIKRENNEELLKFNLSKNNAANKEEKKTLQTRLNIHRIPGLAKIISPCQSNCAKFALNRQ